MERQRVKNWGQDWKGRYGTGWQRVRHLFVIIQNALKESHLPRDQCSKVIAHKRQDALRHRL